MKVFTPREIIEKIDQNMDAFSGAKLLLSMTSGSSYFGELIGISQSRDGSVAVLRSGQTGDHQWVSLNYLESLSIQAITDEQLAVLSGHTFDPFKDKPEPGKLALGRAVQDAEGRITKAVSKNLKLIFTDSAMSAGTTDRALQVNVLQAVMGFVVSIIEKHFTEDFAKDELCKAVEMIELRPAEKASVSLKGQTMEIHCPWKEPSERWKETTLKDAINACF